MAECTLDKAKIERTVEFHGHWCPGLAIGIRASEYALNEIGHATDEEVVAVVETDMCGVDAIQFLTGCTFGKGNLIHLDHGKMAFTFFRRSDGKSARLVFKPEVYGEDRQEFLNLQKRMAMKEALTEAETQRLGELRARFSQTVMDRPFQEVFEVKPAERAVPKKARILASLVCESCGESTMESRTRQFGGKVLCIPCFNAVEQKV